MTVSGVFKPASAGLGLATSRRHPADEIPGGGTVHGICEAMRGLHRDGARLRDGPECLVINE